MSKTSEAAAFTVMEVAAVPPVAVMAPVCVMLPPATKVKLRPMLEAASCMAPLVVSATSLVPLFDKETVPVKALL